MKSLKSKIRRPPDKSRSPSSSDESFQCGGEAEEPKRDYSPPPASEASRPLNEVYVGDDEDLDYASGIKRQEANRRRPSVSSASGSIPISLSSPGWRDASLYGYPRSPSISTVSGASWQSKRVSGDTALSRQEEPLLVIHTRASPTPFPRENSPARVRFQDAPETERRPCSNPNTSVSSSAESFKNNKADNSFRSLMTPKSRRHGLTIAKSFDNLFTPKPKRCEEPGTVSAPPATSASKKDTRQNRWPPLPQGSDPERIARRRHGMILEAETWKKAMQEMEFDGEEQDDVT